MINIRSKFMRLVCVVFVLSVMCQSADAQRRRKAKPQWGYGAAVIYNFQTTGLGADIRIKIPIAEGLSVVPEFSYFPKINDYHEYYVGGALHYELFTLKSYNFYPLAAAYYNNWINADEFAPGMRKQHNFAPEVGGGLVRNRGCLRPFIEYRYDLKWKENNLRIGIYWYPGSCGNGKSNRKEKCPVVT